MTSQKETEAGCALTIITFIAMPFALIMLFAPFIVLTKLLNQLNAVIIYLVVLIGYYEINRKKKEYREYLNSRVENSIFLQKRKAYFSKKKINIEKHGAIIEKELIDRINNRDFLTPIEVGNKVVFNTEELQPYRYSSVLNMKKYMMRSSTVPKSVKLSDQLSKARTKLRLQGYDTSLLDEILVYVRERLTDIVATYDIPKATKERFIDNKEKELTVALEEYTLKQLKNKTYNEEFNTGLKEIYEELKKQLDRKYKNLEEALNSHYDLFNS